MKKNGTRKEPKKNQVIKEIRKKINKKGRLKKKTAGVRIEREKKKQKK